MGAFDFAGREPRDKLLVAFSRTEPRATNSADIAWFQLSEPSLDGVTDAGWTSAILPGWTAFGRESTRSNVVVTSNQRNRMRATPSPQLQK